jgi:hypothetical protein
MLRQRKHSVSKNFTGRYSFLVEVNSFKTLEQTVMLSEAKHLSIYSGDRIQN